MTIDMLRNGMDSLKRGFSCYHEYSTNVKGKEQPLLDDYFILKQAVLSTHHGVEILLKYILDKKSVFLIVDEIDSTYEFELSTTGTIGIIRSKNFVLSFESKISSLSK